MPDICQLRVSWEGLPGLPGVSTFYYSTADALTLADTRAFFESLKAFFPPGLTIRYPNGGMKVDSSTGHPTGTWVGTQPAPTTGTGTGGYAAPTGAVVNWNSELFIAGRQLRGKTFIVPLAGNCYDTDGSLSSGVKNALEAAANLLRITPAIMTVWSRKMGTTAPVRSVRVPDKACVLRTRRA